MLCAVGCCAGLYRRAQAYYQTRMFDDGLADCKRAVVLDPANKVSVKERTPLRSCVVKSAQDHTVRARALQASVVMGDCYGRPPPIGVLSRNGSSPNACVCIYCPSTSAWCLRRVALLQAVPKLQKKLQTQVDAQSKKEKAFYGKMFG